MRQRRCSWTDSTATSPASATDLKAPLGKAAALAEAKAWLRNLPVEDAAKLTAAFTNGVVRADREKGEKALELVVPKIQPGKGSTPFAHPKYWAAFILIGDPN